MEMGESTSVLVNGSKQEPEQGGDSMSATAPAATASTTSATPPWQQTLATSFSKTGVGLHSGQTVHVRVSPAPEHTGRVFVRTDCSQSAPIPATIHAVQTTLLSTELGNGDVSVRTVEHLLAALMAAGVDNAVIEIDGPEVPLLDGSAKEWGEAIAHAGVHLQTASRPTPTLKQPLWCYQGDAFVAALPAKEPRFSYGIDFPAPAIGNQWHSWSPQQESFLDTIAPARTFTLAHQIDHLRQQGLIKGGSLDNAIVCDVEKGWINPPLRFLNEPVRHKLLDLVGDLSLLGVLPCVHVLAYKASHTLHTEFARKLVASYDNTQ